MMGSDDTHRRVSRLMIYVHKSTLDIRKHLDLVLQLLADIVGLPQRGSSIHDDVHLDDVILVKTVSERNTSNDTNGTHRSALHHRIKLICNHT
jgi:hypothetical protein